MKKRQIRLALVASVAVSLSAFATVNSISPRHLSAPQEAPAVEAMPVARSSSYSTTPDSAAVTTVSVTLSTAGTLGEELLMQVNKLTDVQELTICGPLNDADWAIIKQLTSIVSIDMSAATTATSMPNYTFYNLSALTSCLLPEGLTGIGQYAFSGTKITSIKIPSSVKSLGNYAFRSCDALQEVVLPEGLTSIPSACFSYCSSLSKLTLPTTLASIGSNAFEYAKNLTNIAFPAGLTKIEYYAFQGSGLTSVVLPLGLSTLGSQCFAGCSDLTYVELPAYGKQYSNEFASCYNIKKIVCHSATPISISSDPFSGARKANIELVVPSFALVDYKLDSYWNQFGTITGSEETQSLYNISSSLSLKNNRRMSGSPDIILGEGGQLSIGGDDAQAFGTFDAYLRATTSAGGSLISDCPNVSAQAVNSHYYVYSGYWYFLTPVHDVVLDSVKHSDNGAFVFRYYDCANRAANGTGSNWKNVEGGKLEAGKGYIVQSNTSGTLTLPATADGTSQLFVSTDVTTPLEAHASEEDINAHWNFVGNPYPSYYDIYYMDVTAPITVWDKDDRTYQALSVADDDYALAPMQAFFVQKPDELSAIVFHKEGRQFTSTISHTTAAKASRAAAAQSRKVYNLTLSTGDKADKTRVVLNEAASTGYELTCDASKFMSLSSDVPQLFTIDANGNRLAINERPAADGLVALGFYAPEAGDYTLYLGREDGTVSISDAVTGQTVTPADGRYTFAVDAAGTVSDRFTLRFADSSITSVSGLAAGTSTVKAGQGCITVTTDAAATLRILALDGKTIAEEQLTAGSKTYPLAAGLYLVNVDGKATKCIVF